MSCAAASGGHDTGHAGPLPPSLSPSRRPEEGDALWPVLGSYSSRVVSLRLLHTADVMASADSRRIRGMRFAIVSISFFIRVHASDIYFFIPSESTHPSSFFRSVYFSHDNFLDSAPCLPRLSPHREGSLNSRYRSAAQRVKALSLMSHCESYGSLQTTHSARSTYFYDKGRED